MTGIIVLYRSRLMQRKWYWKFWPIFERSSFQYIIANKRTQPRGSTVHFALWVFDALVFCEAVKPSQSDTVGHDSIYWIRCHVWKKSNFICIKFDTALHPRLCFVKKFIKQFWYIVWDTSFSYENLVVSNWSVLNLFQ